MILTSAWRPPLPRLSERPARDLAAANRRTREL